MMEFICKMFGFVLVLIGIIMAYYKWILAYWKRKLVDGPSPLFFFGNAKEILYKRKNLNDLVTNAYVKYKEKGLRYCGLYLLSTPVLVLIDLDLIREVLTKDFQYFTDHSQYINAEKNPLTAHLFSLKGSQWRRLRAKLTPAFSAGKIKMMYPLVSECSRKLLEVVDEMVKASDIFDMRDISSRYTIDVIGTCVFGLECNSMANPNCEFRKHTKKILEYGKLKGFAKLLAFTYPKLVDTFNIKTIDEKAEEFFINTIRDTVEYRETNSFVRKDFIHLLIQLKNNVNIKENDYCKDKSEISYEEKPLTMTEVVAQAYLFFMAGFETSSNTLTFCFYELAVNVQVQEKLRSEINSVLEKYQGHLTYEALSEMNYLEQCINETLRIYPPLPVLNRECTKDYKVPGSNLVIEKGTRIFIPTFGIHRDSEYYLNPGKFDPDRFTSGNKRKRHPFCWLPFGEGPRLCIGMRFGMIQTKVFLALMLKNYKFTLNPKTQRPLTLDYRSQILDVRGGIWLNVEKL